MLKCLFASFVWGIASFSQAFDHSHKTFDTLLKKVVKLDGKQALVNYSHLKNDRKLNVSFNSYLKDLSRVTTIQYDSFTRDQKLAFLINAYNAFTFKLIVDNYPTKSIRKIFTWSDPWKEKFFKLLGEDMNLNMIEHGIIRKKFKEPRIHFAVVCASIGCPNILKNAYTSSNLESELGNSERHFFQDQNKNYYNSSNGKIYVSKIFDWYGDDFKQTKQGSLIKYLMHQHKLTGKEPGHSYLSYSWDLNEWKE